LRRVSARTARGLARLPGQVEQLGKNTATLVTYPFRADERRFFCASESGSPEEIQKALDAAKGIDINGRDHEGATPLMRVASANPHPESVRKILDAGATVNSLTTYKRSALIFAAAESRYPEIINMLVQAGANTAIVNMDGDNALAAARKNNSANPGIEAALIRAGAQ
jgi:ankyrin repeat protein